MKKLRDILQVLLYWTAFFMMVVLTIAFLTVYLVIVATAGFLSIAMNDRETWRTDFRDFTFGLIYLAKKVWKVLLI